MAHYTTWHHEDLASEIMNLADRQFAQRVAAWLAQRFTLDNQRFDAVEFKRRCGFTDTQNAIQTVNVMESSNRYRLRYRIPGLHRKDHECVLDYIGLAHVGYASEAYVMSGRPIIGTQELERRWVNSIVQVPKSTPIEPGRVAR